MSDQIPMRSASERRDAARGAVAEYEARSQRLGESVTTTYERALYSALIPLLEVPEVGISERDIVKMASLRLITRLEEIGVVITTNVHAAVDGVLTDTVRLTEQAALEHWEPADVPSQEFMLRHLGIIHRPIPENGRIGIPEQFIDKEVF
ncbi:hypothetical protein SEA_SALLYK_86 [Microbacterium phage SallyK]|nr:hypothetical protein SEA_STRAWBERRYJAMM_90 [Microbacterium phage StrawberryJamm]WKW84952.1 hypothetical protein SEA_SALLYK_86 [Microbacterium phage SallyK]